MIKEIEGTNLVAVVVPVSSDEFSMCLECQILGKVRKDKIGFDVEPYVEKTTWHFPEEHIVYRNYAEPLEDENSVTGEWRQAWNKSFATKEESFYSRLAANGLYFENPVNKPETEGHPHYPLPEYISEWQSYEDNLIKGKLLIIQKINSK